MTDESAHRATQGAQEPQEAGEGEGVATHVPGWGELTSGRSLQELLELLGTEGEPDLSEEDLRRAQWQSIKDMRPFASGKFKLSPRTAHRVAIRMRRRLKSELGLHPASLKKKKKLENRRQYERYPWYFFKYQNEIRDQRPLKEYHWVNLRSDWYKLNKKTRPPWGITLEERDKFLAWAKELLEEEGISTWDIKFRRADPSNKEFVITNLCIVVRTGLRTGEIYFYKDLDK